MQTIDACGQDINRDLFLKAKELLGEEVVSVRSHPVQQETYMVQGYNLVKVEPDGERFAFTPPKSGPEWLTDFSLQANKIIIHGTTQEVEITNLSTFDPLAGLV